MSRLVVAAVAAIALALVGLDGPAEASSPFGLTLKVSKSVMTLGTTVTLTGAVTPAVTNKTITIQEYVDNTHWVTIGSTQVASSGAFSKVLTPTTDGLHRYRATTAAYGSHTAATTGTRSVTVYEWIGFDHLIVQGETPTTPPLQAATIGGRDYDKAWVSGDDGSRADIWPLAGDFGGVGRCTKISGFAGLEASSDADAVGSLTFHSYGPSTVTTATSTSIERVVLPVSSGYLHVTAARTGPSDARTVVSLGDPKAYCSAPDIVVEISH